MDPNVWLEMENAPRGDELPGDARTLMFVAWKRKLSRVFNPGPEYDRAVMALARRLGV